MIGSTRKLTLLKVFGYIVSVLPILVACKKERYTPVDSVPNKQKKVSLMAGTEQCKECHEKEYRSWKNSDHDLAMQLANSQSVLGDFDNAVFESHGVRYTFYKEGENYYVNTQGAHNKYRDFKIAYTFGVYPLQQYLVVFPKGKYQCLLVAWNVKTKSWFDLQASQNVEKTDWLHWTRGSMTWNAMCADCHSTGIKKNYTIESNSYKTSFKEINVSCESCHGPAAAHVKYYKTKDYAEGKYVPKLKSGRESVKSWIDICARCHSRRAQLTAYYKLNSPFLNHYKPSLILPPWYQPDGQVKDEVYVYGSFLQSKMYQNGVTCTDCHKAHSLELKKKGNSLCLTCHASKYNSSNHHFHRTASQGARCVNCHMPGKKFMTLDFRRDHSFRIPRPDQSVKYGTSNACTSCHTDKSALWATRIVNRWFGPNREDHYSDHLLKAYQGDTKEFLKVVEETGYPAIIRASALRQYGRNISTKIAFKYWSDPSPLIRNEALSAMAYLPSDSILTYMERSLLDSVRLVRITAARYLHSIKKYTVAMKEAKDEYLEELAVNSDFPAGQHEWGLYYQSQQDTVKAIQAYSKALDIDDHFTSSRMNLALLYYQCGQKSKAEELYLKVITQEPDYSYPYFMLGLYYNEMEDESRSLDYLKKACEKKPVLVNAFYNYALLLYRHEKYQESIAMLQRGIQYFNNEERLYYVKLLNLIKLRAYKKAQQTVKKLLLLRPSNEKYKAIQTSLKHAGN